MSDEDVKRLENINIYFCRSYSPSFVTELNNITAMKTMRLIIIEAEYLKGVMPEIIVAIILHEIGHVFNPHQDLRQGEFNADDFVISKGYGQYLKSNLISSIYNEPKTFDKPINRARIERILD